MALGANVILFLEGNNAKQGFKVSEPLFCKSAINGSAELFSRPLGFFEIALVSLNYSPMVKASTFQS